MFGFIDPSLTLLVCSFAMIYFVLIEITELINGYRGKSGSYYANPLNWVDMLLILSWYFYCTVIWEYGP